MKVAIINTGGTISCVGNPLAPMTAADFAQAGQTLLNPILRQQYPGLQVTYLTNVAFPESTTKTLDSTNLQPTDWCIMATAILNNYSDFDGFVILHGTDSMDFTGTGLSFLLNAFDANGYATAALSKPVIITGSQVPMFYKASNQQLSLNFNTDAFQNFCGAVASAQSGVPEVCVYFDSALYRGNRSVKTNASGFNAFSSPNYPPLGRYGIEFAVDFKRVLPPPVSRNISLDNPAVLEAMADRLAAISANINSVPVMQFNAFPAWYAFNDTDKTCSGLIASLLTACADQGIRGLVLESYGEGNFPSGNPDTPAMGSVYQALQKMNARGIVIVDCTQVIQGVVNDSAYAAGAWLPRVGALSPADMTPMAALAKLTILMASAGWTGNNWSLDVVKRLFQIDLLGEMLDVCRLDSRTQSVLAPGQQLTTLDGSASLTNDPMSGPILKASTGGPLWQPLINPSPDQMPGQLVMQNDGNLVFYGRNNAPMWATNTGVPNGASSMLVLGGSATDNTLSLLVQDYSRGQTTRTLYPAQGA